MRSSERVPSRPKLKDVAEQAGVSISTASRVLNGINDRRRISAQVCERVQAAAERLGYRSAYHRRAINRGRSETFGVALDVYAPTDPPGPPSVLTDSFFARLLAGVEQATHRAGLNLSLIVPTKDRRAGERGLAQMREGRLDGLVVFPTVAPGHLDPMVQALTREGNIPAVVGAYVDGPRPFATINPDSEQAVRLLMEHLRELGHRELVWFGPEGRRGSETTRSDREQAFLALAFEFGMTGKLVRYPSRYPLSVIDSLAASDQREAIFAAFLDRDRPQFTAVIGYNDVAAISATRALQRRGRVVPRDVSVVGIDHIDAAHSTLRLTTIDQRLEDVGRLAGEWLQTFMDADSNQCLALASRHDHVTPLLHIRETSAPAPSIHL